MALRYQPHQFGPSETIEAVIQLYNSHAMDKTILAFLMLKYNIQNELKVPRAGEIVDIPVLEGYYENE